MESAQFDASALSFGEVRKDGGKVTVPFGPASIVTGVVALKGGLVDADGTVAPFAKLALGDADAAAFEAFEEALLAAAKEKREEWFGSKDVSDEHVEGAFKRFFEKGALKARVTAKTFAFDSAGNAADVASFAGGDKAKALLSASVVRIGKNEFGAVWTLDQLRAAKKPVACLIADEPESIVDDEDSWIV